MPDGSCRGACIWVAVCSRSLATTPVQPVWWLAPTPRPLSPWKYSWKGMYSRQCGSLWNSSTWPNTGRRPVFGDCAKLQDDPHFRDYVLFHEYFHGDSGRGAGAAHQTGWTGLVAKLLQPRREERVGECSPPAAPRYADIAPA